MVSAKDMIHMILLRYSDSNGIETCCSMSELERDLLEVIEHVFRERDDITQRHEAWLRIQKSVEDNRSFLSRLF